MIYYRADRCLPKVRQCSSVATVEVGDVLAGMGVESAEGMARVYALRGG